MTTSVNSDANPLRVGNTLNGSTTATTGFLVASALATFLVVVLLLIKCADCGSETTKPVAPVHKPPPVPVTAQPQPAPAIVVDSPTSTSDLTPAPVEVEPPAPPVAPSSEPATVVPAVTDDEIKPAPVVVDVHAVGAPAEADLTSVPVQQAAPTNDHDVAPAATQVTDEQPDSPDLDDYYKMATKNLGEIEYAVAALEEFTAGGSLEQVYKDFESIVDAPRETQAMENYEAAPVAVKLESNEQRPEEKAAAEIDIPANVESVADVQPIIQPETVAVEAAPVAATPKTTEQHSESEVTPAPIAMHLPAEVESETLRPVETAVTPESIAQPEHEVAAESTKVDDSVVVETMLPVTSVIPAAPVAEGTTELVVATPELCEQISEVGPGEQSTATDVTKEVQDESLQPVAAVVAPVSSELPEVKAAAEDVPAKVDSILDAQPTTQPETVETIEPAPVILETSEQSSEVIVTVQTTEIDAPKVESETLQPIQSVATPESIEQQSEMNVAAKSVEINVSVEVESETPPQVASEYPPAPCEMQEKPQPEPSPPSLSPPVELSETQPEATTIEYEPAPVVVDGENVLPGEALPEHQAREQPTETYEPAPVVMTNQLETIEPHEPATVEIKQERAEGGVAENAQPTSAPDVAPAPVMEVEDKPSDTTLAPTQASLAELSESRSEDGPVVDDDEAAAVDGESVSQSEHEAKPKKRRGGRRGKRSGKQ